MGTANFYRDEPLFGLDIGHSNLKVMQFEFTKGKMPKVLGYGANRYPPEAISNGSIKDYKALNKSLYDLFNEHLVGSITSKRVACTLPTSRTFSRPMKLPLMDDEKNIKEAVHLEAEQYIPIPPASLYIDYEVTNRHPDGLELLMVATPKNIIDTYVTFLEGVGLEPVALEPTLNASSRLFSIADSSSNDPSILIDFGSVAVDLAVFNKTIFVNSTVAGGSDTITDLIAKNMGLSPEEAYGLKNKFGIAESKKKDEIMKAVKPMLDNLIREIQKILRYYDDRMGTAQHKIVQIVTIGGGANMPGLSEYFSDQLHLPARMLDPWNKIDFGKLPLPSETDRSMYITAAGEAILSPKEIFS